MACLRGDPIQDRWLRCELTQTTCRQVGKGRVGPATTLGRTRAQIREGTRKLQLHTKCQLVHVDRANEITVTSEAADAAHPIAVLGFVFMPTSGTLARGSSFGASEARDMGLLGFVRQIVDITTIFPLAHTLVMVFATVFGADAMRVANEERTNVIVDTKVNDLPGGLVA